jgi:uncharacterized protein (TIGR02594 family)
MNILMLRTLNIFSFFLIISSFSNAKNDRQVHFYSDSLKADSISINDAWRYCGDPFLMDLACVNNLHDSILNIPIILEARKYYGIRDIIGKANEQRVLEFFRAMGIYYVKNDEVSWCSVFIGACAKNVGLQYTKLATARSWLEVGSSVNEPVPGDIVVFWREDPDSWKGHVSIYLGTNIESNEVYALGGNQNDEVCILTYKLDTVLGYRRLQPKLK